MLTSIRQEIRTIIDMDMEGKHPDIVYALVSHLDDILARYRDILFTKSELEVCSDFVPKGNKLSSQDLYSNRWFIRDFNHRLHMPYLIRHNNGFSNIKNSRIKCEFALSPPDSFILQDMSPSDAKEIILYKGEFYWKE